MAGDCHARLGELHHQSSLSSSVSLCNHRMNNNIIMHALVWEPDLFFNLHVAGDFLWAKVSWFNP